MKTILLCLLTFVVANAAAQSPQTINYQAIARNAIGAVMPNQNIGIRFSIRDSSATGQIVYQETNNAITNQFGLFAKSIGSGNPTIATFGNISWETGDKYLQVELDINGGANFIDMGTMQMLSVPYALYAKDAATVKSAKTLIYLSH